LALALFCGIGILPMFLARYSLFTEKLHRYRFSIFHLSISIFHFSEHFAK